MIKLKSQHALLACVVIVVLSAVYVLAAYALLRPQSASLTFTLKEIQGLDDYNRAAALYFDLNTTQNPQPVAAKTAIEAARRPATAWDKARARLEAHPHPSFAVVDQTLHNLIRDIGDESNLILDPEISSYYAADFLVNDVPLFVAHILARNGDDPDSRQDSLYHLDSLNHSIQSICQSNHEGCPHLQALAAAFEKSFLPETSSRARPDEATALMKDIATIAQASSAILKSFLQERLQNKIGQRHLMLVSMVCLYVFLVFLSAFSLQNYASRREINLALETRKLASQLAQKNDELEKFAYAAAHDLKEPVRTMRCYATLLKSEALSDLKPSSAEYIGIIEGASKRAEQMINDLLGYTQVSEEPLLPESCDTAQELAAVLADLKLLIDKARPEITQSALPVLSTVPSMFRRVLANLIDNAIKYRKTETTLRIHIQAECQDDFWIFSVRDNGIGVAKEHTESAFEPFKRLPPALVQEGQGIGLTSCRKIVERLGGRIWMTSHGSEGTTASFSLPLSSKNS